MPPHRPIPMKKEKLSVASLLKILSYGRRYLPLVLLALLFAIAASVASIIAPTQVRELTDAIQQGIFKPEGVDMNAFTKTGIVLITVYLISIVSGFAQRILTNEATHRLARRLRSEIGHKIDRLPLRYFDSNEVGDILSRVTNDVDTISQTLGTSIAELLSAIQGETIHENTTCPEIESGAVFIRSGVRVSV